MLRKLYNNYTIMNFTTTTKLAREWSKAFKNLNYAVVLHNNTDIGMVIWKELSRALQDSWVLDQIRQELWELNDKETVDSVMKYRSWDTSSSISLDDFRVKYGI